ncbi:MAG: preprotein translocase subunit SecA, partial [Betaproteobacteria bacterium]|nr:preprotein translocase subunit SecA [Betaproteobacteria bacterium]
MFQGLLTKIFGSRNQRLIKQYQQVVGRINALESSVNTLSDEALADKTHLFRERLGRGESLDALLPEAFAVCREASRRVMGMRHFDVQLVGGMVLHQGKIAEMRTGEGKTLMATLPAYLNALTGQGVHVVTVNDYLAARDADWMGSLYRFLGLRVGVILSQQDNASKHDAYAADITYGTNNEFGFDYLRDNMEYAAQDRRQRKLAYAIVDEVDSILIDEARTPLIISGQAEDQTGLYTVLNQIPPLLSRMAHEPKPQEPEPEGDYWVDLKSFAVHLSEQGHEHAEAILQRMALLPAGASLYDPAHIALMHHLMAALRAHSLYVIDQHYVVQNREVIIVDEFTGRLMQGRRWSDGLHQAIEAKENVPIQPENQTLASITFQNYFRMYGKLAGMTGTADTEAFEFQEIYGLETVVVPTHRPMIRDDRQDQVFRTAREKYQAILVDIRDCHARGQPVLVGTTSIENSELIASMLHKEKLPHQVLNAKQHALDNQLRGRSGRQGDPGSSRFYLSMEDPLLKIFAGDRLMAIMDKLKLPDGEAIEAGMVSRSIESAQRKVEARNFDIRKQLLEYDDLQAIDNHWRDHLSTLDYLRQGIHLRGYAQKNPKQEYKREAFELFARLQERIRGDVVKLLMTVTIASPEQAQAAQALQAQQQAGLQIKLIHSDAEAAGMGLQAASASEAGLPDAQSLALAAQQLPGSAQSQDAQTAQQPLRRFGEKIGRNDPCPCGSGKK